MTYLTTWHEEAWKGLGTDMNIPPTDPPGEDDLRFQLSMIETELRVARDKVLRLERSRDRLLCDLAACVRKGAE